MRLLAGWLAISAIALAVFWACAWFADDPEDTVNELDGIPPLIRRRGSE